MTSSPLSTAPAAFISVFNKTNLDKLAIPLVEQYGYRLVATGGTRRFLESAGLQVEDLSDVTGFNELLGGRVKSLHPVVFASILAKQDNPEDMAQLGALPAFQVVCVNLYPFEEGLQRKQSGEDPELDLVELIDIGGSSLLRAAAKNYKYVSVLSDVKQYDGFLSEMQSTQGQPALSLRKELAQQAFQRSVAYDAAISGWFASETGVPLQTTTNIVGTSAAKVAAPQIYSSSPLLLPETLTLQLNLKETMRYGENPHQPAALYEVAEGSAVKARLASADTLLHGKALSYNNVLDMEAAWSLICEFDAEPTVAIIKHTQPCGVASANQLKVAYDRALACDPLSAFGGVVALNRPVDEPTALMMSQLFLEVIVAPEFSPEALAVLQKKKNIRLVTRPFVAAEQPEFHPASRNDGLWLRQVSPGRFLAQVADYAQTEQHLEQHLKVVTKKKPTMEELRELAFAWRVAKHLKSNAIVIAAGRRTVGLCGGQTSRVGAVEKALAQACEQASHAVLASDGFFPALDNIEMAAQNRIAAIIQPGGSIKDPEVIEACDRYGIAMVTTSIREFKH